ncbi:MAG: NAD-dependent epimerase/dehydratase family protein [Anaerolineales bacterium]|jgi:nucleoside-diphosphate-sugar epimerase
MRVLITGGGGFIGSHLVADQLRRGRQVTAVDLNTRSLQHLVSNPDLHIVEGDFTDRALLDPILEGQDVCFHLASAHLETGMGDEYFWKINVEGTRDFVERCDSASVKRFVHCSSVGVYGDLENPPADEETECRPDVAYEKSKLAGEEAVLEYARQAGYDVVIIRPAWVYGPRCPRTEKLFRTIEKGRFFFVGDGKTLRHPIYITDMVEGFEAVAASERASGEVFIIAGPRAVTLEELANEIADCIGVPRPSLKLPQALVWSGCMLLEFGFPLIGKQPPFTRRSLKFYTGNTAFSIEKANELLEFRPKTKLPQGIQRTHGWLKTRQSQKTNGS